jgi:hypothetical protein
MAVVLDRAQRDAVHRFVVSDLYDVGIIGRELDEGKVASAQALRQRFDEDARLLDALGWAQADDRQRFELSMPAAEIRAVFTRLYQRATLEVEEGMAIVQQLPIAHAAEAARVCSEVMRSVGQVRRLESRSSTTGLLHEVRRPDCFG